MRAILKGAEPKSLIEYRAARNAIYGDYKDKDSLRKALVDEQRGLCCYCLSRIRPEIGSMRIEHWHSQTAYPLEQLDYPNLLGACSVSEGQPWKDQHCDVRKGERDLSRNPAHQPPRVEDLLHFLGDGRVRSDVPDFDLELNEALNLNVAFLVNERKAVLDAFKKTLEKKGGLGRGTLEKWLADWNGDSHTGELRPFCQVIVYWLQKRLART